MLKNKTRLTIVNGFLGSGKTTFLNHYMTQILKKDEKVALIVNEFVDFDVDSRILKDYNVKKSILQGCICCDLQHDLIAVLYQLSQQENNVDHIIIEATGIANPIDVLIACQDPLIAQAFENPEAICIVDSSRFLSRQNYSKQTLDLLEDQVRASQTIVINKVDLLTNDSDLKEIVEAIETIAPKSRVLISDHGQVQQTVIENTGAEYTLPEHAHRHGHHAHHNHEHHHDGNHHHDHHHAHYTSLKYTFSSAISQAQLVQFILKLPENVLRLKGYVRLRESPNEMYLIQYAQGLPTIESVGDVDFPSSVVLIGEQLDEARLRNNLDVLQFS
ncbi:CobW family GTP-binding protein [Staphylococcus schleiferi]|uniref:CobW family GTP-binding protein n=1 Tax=Staphylococcus schleiferi TaxID=1295 RepID=UPI00143062BB|nr:GTP-binding protein [Staphylococcus schleiferi]NHA43465.1 GTP-binding protein [Staphylococcus schleiferi]UXR54652.1 GTP-binding protein [Staphylococcus schleiferi]UXR56960.1 GTP-binding protein [Staphylococcus schleiferi]UXR59244.1 GTP-binding protein [Staphylococcus schleiferi]UXR61558.1 GTP-binding protein [Staphylococcus schleiferi]